MNDLKLQMASGTLSPMGTSYFKCSHKKQKLAKAKPELSHLRLLNPFNAELYAATPAEHEPEVFLSAVALSIDGLT